MAALYGALARLSGAMDDPQAVAAATEAAWWITTTDAAMSRHHPAAYGRALAAIDPAERRAIEKSLTGLRYVRGQLGYHADPADFIQERLAAEGSAPAGWAWSVLPPARPQRSSARDASPYREYRAQLADRPLTEALKRTAGFLGQVHAIASHPGQRDIPAPSGQYP